MELYVKVRYASQLLQLLQRRKLRQSDIGCMKLREWKVCLVLEHSVMERAKNCKIS